MAPVCMSMLEKPSPLAPIHSFTKQIASTFIVSIIVYPKLMYFVQKPPTDSRSTTPLAAKKPSAKLNSIFDSDEDDDLFRASNVGSKHNLVNFCYEYVSIHI